MEITLFFLLRVSHVVTSAYFKHGSDFNKLVTILNPRTISRKQRILSYDSTNDFSGCWNHTTCFRWIVFDSSADFPSVDKSSCDWCYDYPALKNHKQQFQCPVKSPCEFNNIIPKVNFLCKQQVFGWSLHVHIKKIGLEGNSVVFPLVLIFDKMLINRTWSNRRTSTSRVGLWKIHNTTLRKAPHLYIHHDTLLHTQETKTLCAHLAILYYISLKFHTIHHNCLSSLIIKWTTMHAYCSVLQTYVTQRAMRYECDCVDVNKNHVLCLTWCFI